MYATNTINAMSGLKEAQRQRALQLKAQIEAMEAELQTLLREPMTQEVAVDLQARCIDKTQAADLRTRLKTFAEDWDRPETAIYDESPAR